MANTRYSMHMLSRVKKLIACVTPSTRSHIAIELDLKTVAAAANVIV